MITSFTYLVDGTVTQYIGYCHHIVVGLFVRPSVCNAVHCGAQGRCRGLKVVTSSF